LYLSLLTAESLKAVEVEDISSIDACKI